MENTSNIELLLTKLVEQNDKILKELGDISFAVSYTAKVLDPTDWITEALQSMDQNLK